MLFTPHKAVGDAYLANAVRSFSTTEADTGRTGPVAKKSWRI